jgi:hypothetical protein
MPSHWRFDGSDEIDRNIKTITMFIFEPPRASSKHEELVKNIQNYKKKNSKEICFISQSIWTFIG